MEENAFGEINKISSSMGIMMKGTFERRLSQLDELIKDLKNGKIRNKKEIMLKLNQSKKLLTKLKELLNKQSKIQREIFKTMHDAQKIDFELDKLLEENGCE